MSSRASSVTEEMLAAQEQYLTTILERTETNTMETLERVRKSKAELGPPPVHARLRVQHKVENMTSRESDSESQYSHDPLGTDLDLTEDERDTVNVRRAVVTSDRLQSARLVESVQTRASEHVTRHEQEVRERAGSRHAQQQSGFDVTVRTTEAGAGAAYSDEDTAKWRDIVTHDSTFRTMIESAQTTEDVESAVSQIRYISKYEKMFEPHKWDVLVRVLQTP